MRGPLADEPANEERGEEAWPSRFHMLNGNDDLPFMVMIRQGNDGQCQYYVLMDPCQCPQK